MISLGVDIGGTGCKCVAFRDDGTQLALAYEEYPLQAGQTNLPADILTDSVFRVIAQCAGRLEDRAQVAAVTVASFGESFAAVDRDGQALTDILLYFGNAESEAFDRLVERVGEQRFMDIARIYPDASYSLSKMLYTLSAAEKPVWKFLHVAGFLCWKLTGRPCTDVSLACRSLLFDVKNRCWSRELVEACGIDPETLPEVLPTGAAVGTLLPELAQKLGLPQQVQVVIGGHDQIVNALGAGVSCAGEAVDTSGTCECLTPLFAEMPENPAFVRDNYACVPYLEGCGYVTYAYNISAGSVVRWFRDVLGGALPAEAGTSIYDRMNGTCPQEPTDLMILPFLQGMGGTPDTDPRAAGLIVGLTTQTRLPELYRAILEGITFEMRYNLEKLRQNGVSPTRLYACGGGAGSPAWLQIKADILGCEILPVPAKETGAMGSAILGLAASSGKTPFAVAQSFWRCGEPIRPDGHRQQIYNQRFEAYKAVRSLYRQHPVLQRG